MPLAQNKPLLANPDIVFRKEEEGAFLFDPKTGELKCLNPMGSLIWLLCDGSLSLEQIQQKITKQYPQVPCDSVLQELQAFLQDLFQMGYLGYRLADGSMKDKHE